MTEEEKPTERELKLRTLVKLSLAIIIVLSAVLVWNVIQLHTLRTISGGEFISVPDCQSLVDVAQLQAMGSNISFLPRGLGP